MDTDNLLSRRHLLKAAPAVAAVAILPTASTAAPALDPGERLAELMQEISQILDTQLMGTFCAVIEPSRHERAIVSLKPIRDVRNAFALAHFTEHAGFHALQDYHLGRAAVAIQKQFGGCWVAAGRHGGGATIYRDERGADGVWVSAAVEG